jgi:hypothetical protein|tara:strand:- start:246 stop:890 length:645 start_codon:yes stop_codon:yes gene_type:complete
VRLVTFGCSFTQGIGLDGLDYTAHQYYYTPLESVLKIKSASKDAWPHLLADQLGLECINLGRGGNSPKYVFQMIREFDFQKTDIVVIQWPQPDRHVIWKDGVEGYEPLLEIASTNGYAEEYFKSYHTDFDSYYTNALLIENINAYLKDRCDQVHHVSDTNEMSENKILSKSFPILSEVGTFFNQYHFNDLCDDGHPGKTYHNAFATRIKEKIQS